MRTFFGMFCSCNLILTYLSSCLVVIVTISLDDESLTSSLLLELNISFSIKQEEEHYKSLGLCRYNWIFSPWFSSLYQDNHRFLLLASSPKRNRDIITAAPQHQKMQNKPFFLPERLFVWKSLSCIVGISYCLSDCICRFIFACSRLFS